MLNTIILEDEFKLLEVLKIKLKKHCPDVNVVGEANTVQQAFDLINTHNPDLLFLDIALAGETSFELLDRFDSIEFELIFITSYSEYAIQAFKVSATDYLLKPIDNEELIQAVEKVKQKIQEKRKTDSFEVLKHNLMNLGSANTKIIIPGTEAYKFVRVGDIIHFEGWDKYTRIHIAENVIITSSYNIGRFKELVSKFNFFQTHKSHLINMDHVVEYSPEGTVTLSNGNNVPVSRRKKETFLNTFVR